MIIRAVDFECTGIPSEADRHAIVEIGTCDLDVLEDGSTFVNSPESVLCNPGRKIPHSAMAVHHITDGMVEDAKGSLAFIGGDADYYVAHKADYELQFWTPGKPVICTWKVALRLWPAAEEHNLQYLRYHLDLAPHEIWSMPPHRAGPDAYVCALLMERMLQEKRCSIEDMVRWSSGRALLPFCPIGKYRGKPWDDVDTGFLDWMVFKAVEMDPDVKANAILHLKKRGAYQ